MLENQAFGWLKKTIIGGSGTEGTNNTSDDEEISGCSDPSVLINGVSHDFNVLLMKYNNNNSKNAVAQSSSSVPPTSSSEGTAAGVTAAASAMGGGVDLSSATETNDGAPNNNIAKTATAPNDNSQHLVQDSLTARLDRIKTLLYEERSTSTNNVTQSGSLNLNWTPAIATSVFKSFTSSVDDEESSSGWCSGNDISPNNSIVYNINPTKSSSNNDLLPKLIQNLPLLPFEARKSISAIFNYLLVCGLDGVDAKLYTSVSTAFANYVRVNAECVIGQLVRCHDRNSSSCGNNSGSGIADGVIGAAASATTGAGSCVDITLLCGAMLRSSLRHANIYQWILANENCEQLVYPFLDVYVHNPNFDVSSDALETVRVMFTGHALTTAAAVPPTGIVGDAAESTEQYKQIMESVASDFLNRKYADVIDDRINKKCLSSSKANYMTRRMTLQLLSTILLNRVNYNVMMMYISSSKNLVTILCLLRDPSPHITLDAFQVFKIFVANPNKVSY